MLPCPIFTIGCVGEQNAGQKVTHADSLAISEGQVESMEIAVEPHDTQKEDAAESYEREQDLENYGLFGKWVDSNAGISLTLQDNWEFKLEGSNGKDAIKGKYSYELVEMGEGIVLTFDKEQRGKSGDLIEGKKVKNLGFKALYNEGTGIYTLNKGSFVFGKEN